MRGLIPNAFTMGNLLCGCLAIMSLYEHDNDPMVFIGLLILAAFLDLFDGLFARLLGVGSEMGKQLDSLADAVTFGIAPALMVVELLLDDTDGNGLALGGLLLAVASIHRLAKFNVDTRQSERFIGLPTPSNALFWIAMLGMWSEGTISVEQIPIWGWLIMIVLMSWFMISEIPLISLKFKHLRYRGNEPRFFLIIGGIITLSLCWILANSYFLAVPIILLLYLLISLWDRKNHQNEISR